MVEGAVVGSEVKPKGFNVNKFDPEKYRHKLRKLISRFVPADDVEDVLQNTLARAYAALPSFKGGSQIETWLHRIAVNQCHDHNRKRKNVPVFEPIDEELDANIGDTGVGYFYIGNRNNPLTSAMRRELHEKVHSAMAKLPPKHRQMIQLCELDNVNYADAAKIIGVSEGTIKSGLHRAKKKMRKYLEEYVRA